MAQQTTKYALEKALRKLLLKKPLHKITINDITEECGVNRMTFYYHFKDIYDLVEWMLNQETQKALEGPRGFDTWSEALLDILLKLQADRTLVLNVYRSVGRERVEQYLYSLLDPMLHIFVERETQDLAIRDEDKQFVVDFFKYALVGIVLEWIHKDMKQPPAEITERLDIMLQGSLRRLLLQFCQKNETICLA